MNFLLQIKLLFATFIVAFSTNSAQLNFDSYTNTGEVVLKSSTLSLYDEVLMRIDNVLIKHSNEIKTQSFDVVERIGGASIFQKTSNKILKKKTSSNILKQGRRQTKSQTQGINRKISLQNAKSLRHFFFH